MSWWRRYYRGQLGVDLTRAWRVTAVVSAVAILASVGSLVLRGLELGIEFEGGTSWEYPSTQTVGEVRDVLRPFGLDDAKIQTAGEGTLRVRSAVSDPDLVAEVTSALATSAAADVADMSTSVVGPTWGDTITKAAVRALVVFFVLIAGYLAVRLEWRMAVAAVVAALHDIVITVGVYSVFQFVVTPATVIAVLTILGYSLYDTVVVFDRVRENAARHQSSGRMSYRQVMALSVDQVLVRSINTSVTTILPVATTLVMGSVALGAAPLQEFAIALLVGLLVGAYSSVFVAAPTLVVLKEREPRWRQISRRLEARRESGDTAPAEASPGDGVVAAGRPEVRSGPGSPAGTARPAATGPYTHPPRPRKGGRKPRKR